MTQTPLTYAVELLHELDRAVPGRVLNPRFTVRAAYRLHIPTDTGQIDLAALRGALDDLVARHDALRTSYGRDGMRVLPPMPARLVVHEDPGPGFVARISGGEFPPDEPPLLWAHLGLGDGPPTLVLVAHHLAADAWSLAVLARDLVVAYTARSTGGRLAFPDAMPYAAIAADDRSPGWQAHIAEALPYWQRRLTGAAGLGLPAQGPPTPGRPAVHRFGIDQELWQRLALAARRARTTPFTLLLTAYARAFGAGQDEVLVPVLTAGRTPQEWQTVGFLLNVLFLRLDLTGRPSVDELRTRVDDACRAAYAHDIPLLPVLRGTTGLAAAIGQPDRALPLFQFIPRMPPLVAAPPENSLLLLEEMPEDDLPPAVIPASLMCTVRLDASGQLAGYVSYDTHRFSDLWIADLVSGFLDALHALA